VCYVYIGLLYPFNMQTFHSKLLLFFRSLNYESCNVYRKKLIIY
jgi:hypothetical protein